MSSFELIQCQTIHFYFRPSPVTNYFSTPAQSDVSPLDNKEGHAAFTQWTNAGSLTVSKRTPDGMIWLTNQRACELVIQITVCGGYLLPSGFKEIWGTRKPAGRPSYGRSFQTPACESLESCSSRNCRVSLVFRVIQQGAWNWAGPWKCSRWKQNKTERESERELGAERLISTIPKVRWGEGRASHWPLRDCWCHQNGHICDWGRARDWLGTAGAQFQPVTL